MTVLPQVSEINTQKENNIQYAEWWMKIEKLIKRFESKSSIEQKDFAPIDIYLPVYEITKVIQQLRIILCDKICPTESTILVIIQKKATSDIYKCKH